MKLAYFNIASIRKLFRSDKKNIKPAKHTSDRWLIVSVMLLGFLGILMVYDSSVAIALRDFSDQYYFVKEQLRWLAIGVVALSIFSRIDYHMLHKLALPMLLVSLVLLLAVFIPGLGVRALGAHRWIRLGFVILQPSELAKLSLIIYLAAWFSSKESGRLWAFLLLLIMVVGLVLIQPDLGTAFIILSVALLMYFLSGAPLYQFSFLIPLTITLVSIIAIAAPYRMRRFTTFFNPESDPLGSSYHIRQILLALGSGGWFGVGIGQSRQKYEYLPEANTDSIFAIIGEEMGFVGAVGIILLCLFVVWRGFRIAKRAPDSFGKMLALGISSWFAIQVAVNVSSMVALVPLTGVPLPLISYGGSSLIIILTGIGILLNISKHS